jgi:ribonucleoside-diphosphate reductase beta chain
LEIRCARDTMPRDVLGLNAGMFKEYVQHIANRRCNQIGLKNIYPSYREPVPVDERGD